MNDGEALPMRLALIFAALWVICLGLMLRGGWDLYVGLAALVRGL